MGGSRTFPLLTFRMSLPSRIVLHAPVSDRVALAAFVEECLRDGVRLIAVAGVDAKALEDEVDWLVIGDGGDESRFIVTSSHPNESLEEVIEFASGWHCEHDGLLEVRL